MKRVCPVVCAFLWMTLWLPVQTLWAVTYAYIPSKANNQLVRVRTSDGQFSSLDLAGGPHGAAVAPNGSLILVTLTDSDQVAAVTNAVIEGTGTPTLISVGDEPRGVAFDPNGEFAYVANFGDDSVSVITIATLRVSATIAIGDGLNGQLDDGPWGIAAVREPAAGTLKVYVTNTLTGSVSVITNNGAAIVNITSIGANPIGAAATPDGRHVFVANNGSDNVSVISTQTDSVIARIAAGTEPFGVAVGSRGDFVYVTNSNDVFLSNSFNSVTVVQIVRTADFIDFAVVGTQRVGGTRPHGVAAPTNGDFALTVNQGVDENAASTLSRVDVSLTPPVTFSISETTLDPRHPVQGAFGLGAFIGGTPSAAPSAVAGTASAFDRIELSWTDNSDDELGFIIERRLQGGTAFAQIVETLPNATGYTDTGVTSETTYEYRIRAINETSFSDYATSSAVTTPEGDFHWCFIGTMAAEMFGVR